MDALSKAIELAAEKHAGQKDKAGLPYILHPIHVMMNMDTIDEKIVAVLHDIVEDTDLEAQELGEFFEFHIIEAVVILTRLPHQDYQSYIETVGNNKLARRVKIQDIKHNMDLNRLPSFNSRDRKRYFKYKKSLKYLQEIENGSI